jgi:hypothetical protein
MIDDTYGTLALGGAAEGGEESEGGGGEAVAIPLHLLTESFSGTLLNLEKWTNWGGERVTMNNGLFVRVGPDTAYVGIESAATYELMNSSAFVEMIPGPVNLASYEQLFTLQYLTYENSVRWAITGGVISATRFVDGSLSKVGTDVPYNPALHRFFRIRGSGDRIWWDYSANGSIWVTHGWVSVATMGSFNTSEVAAILVSGMWQDEGEQRTSLYRNFNTIVGRSLLIAQQNYLPYYLTDSVTIREKDGVMDMSLVVPTVAQRPKASSEVIFRDNERVLFGGYITRNNSRELVVGKAYQYDIEVSSFAHILTEKVAKRSYEDKTLSFIVLDLMSTYVDSRYGFDVSNVATGPTIKSIAFDHQDLRTCFDKISARTGYIWRVDYEKRLRFTAPAAIPAPVAFTDTSNNYESLDIGYDPSQCRNSVTVIGNSDGEQDVNTTTETFYGDGDARSWELEFKPSEVVSISINGTPQQFSLDVNERETDVFTYSFSGSSFRLTESQTTPTGDGEEGTSQEIEIVYYPRVPIITKEIDEASIAFFRLLDGGDGIKEYTIKEQSVRTKEEASARALEELKLFALPLVNGTVVTRSGLLLGGPVFEVGQALTVNSPTYDINFDAVFTIRDVITTIIENDEGVEYQHVIQFGGRLIGIKEFLESLAARESAVADAELILTLESASDSMTLADEVPTMNTATPPYKYKNGNTPVGKWNLAEWS